ncbi:MAG: hypothetical protein P0119_08130 [Nitrospira sp.]|nr:hypothetical protein [Nitrospira sp.]
MKTKIQRDRRIPHIGWPAGIIGGLLLISVGLELLAHQVFGQTDVGTLLWALYLGFWTFALCTIGFLFLTVRWWGEWKRMRINSLDMNRLSSTESTSSHFEKSELETPLHILQQGEIQVGPGRSSRKCEDRNEVDSHMKVA